MPQQSSADSAGECRADFGWSKDGPEYIYPYSAIPVGARQALTDSFRIADIDHANADDAREMDRRVMLDDINNRQELVRTYCGAEMNSWAYMAAALGPVKNMQGGLGDRQYGSTRAGQALGRFFRANSPTDYYSNENVYIAGLLQDRRRLDKFRQLTQSGEEKIDYRTAPTTDEWLTPPAITDADTLYDAVNSINIESILISGVETLQTLSTRAANDRETLDTIRYSEQIIAPIAEVIGFDALALSLNNATKCLRLKYGGRPDLLTKARSLLSRFRNYDRAHDIAHNTCDAFTDITRQLFGDGNIDVRPNLPVDYNDNNDSVYGDAPISEVQTENGPVQASWRFRLKSAGSLAWKMYQAEKKHRDNSRTSMDILGITAIVPDEAAQTKLFGAMVDGLYSSGGLKPYPAPSKNSPVHIRGTDSYIQRMMQYIHVDQPVDERPASSTDALHLGKITGFYGALPFEIQCVTRHYRDSMQTGQLAHIIYKVSAGGVIDRTESKRWEKLLRDIRSRRNRLGEPGLVGSAEVDGHYRRGANEQRARQFLDDTLSLDDTVHRTIGFIASNQMAADDQPTREA